ncbi:MAG TPA: hypothetical protein VGL41_00305, partial [Roseiarcus sp.]
PRPFWRRRGCSGRGLGARLLSMFGFVVLSLATAADGRAYFAQHSPTNCAPHKSCCAKADFEALIQNIS